jgi:hypothetical protein
MKKLILINIFEHNLHHLLTIKNQHIYVGLFQMPQNLISLKSYEAFSLELIVVVFIKI